MSATKHIRELPIERRAARGSSTKPSSMNPGSEYTDASPGVRSSGSDMMACA